ncbi:MAG: PSD1 and planctomycete cytochrome C domain-containing protein [Verrucomicrobiales bacterium]|nr:PSD1 and planctomycete cytochrome C domain-containing protein [Verrucomicrobiales bacterium]
MSPFKHPICSSLLMLLLCSSNAIAAEAEPRKIDFTKDIRPILSTACFHCHGPDPENREADLRLDTEAGAFASLEGGHHAIVAGKPTSSEAYARITSKDPDELMPPSDSGKQITPDQIKLIQQWIKQGAKWGQHWAFTAPQRPTIPQLTDTNVSRASNPIDHFIFARLAKEGLSPSAPANKSTQLRRLSLDLVGLPPTPVEVDAFLSDQSSNAWNRQIERLLKSQHFGERWGRIWLDAARYADSDGYEKDKPRQVWFYRDWVINSINQDLPYNQFIIEQIAGDLLPNATQDQMVATGFLRNSMINEEGGIDPEEFRMYAMFDRMDAVGKAVLGFTMQCAQCHSHKYDPLSQKDYYRVFSYLNNSFEAQPIVYTSEQRKKRAALFEKIANIENSLKIKHGDWPTRLAAWEESVKATQSKSPKWEALELKNSSGNNGQRYYRQANGSYLAQGYAATKLSAPFSSTTQAKDIRSFQIEMLNHPNLPGGGPGRALFGRYSLSEFQVKAQSIKDPEKIVHAKFIRATADYSSPKTEMQPPYLVKRDGKSSGHIGDVKLAIDGDNKTGWSTDGGPGRHNGEHRAVFVTDKNIAFPGGTKLTITLIQRQGGWNSDDNQTMNLGCFRISISDQEADADPLPREVSNIINHISIQKRNAAQKQQVFSYWRTTLPEWKSANAQIEALWKQHPEGSTQFVYQEMPQGRKTRLLKRGDFLSPEKEVSSGVPSFLHPMPKNAGSGRLAFARWLVDRKSPTTARTIVNRIWQSYFGSGLFETTDDLGSSGASPSHPELLDWLAVELMDHNWSVKHIHRLITSSATYRQSSITNSTLTARDPNNRLLARGPRFRVDAEIVRDIFLSASGLLNPKVGGPSVFPPAPAFLFERPVSYGPKDWQYDDGPDKYRRGLYTFRFRSVPYPALQTFDAPTGEFSVVKRVRSNTPLQALTTLNEDLFVESAQALARLAFTSKNKSDDQRLDFIFRRCVARHPSAEEAALLKKMLSTQTDRLNKGELDAKKILSPPQDHLGKIPPTPALPKGTTPSQLAAWTIVSRVILNMDETITKE